MTSKNIEFYGEDLKEVKLGYSEYNHILLCYIPNGFSPRAEMLKLNDDEGFITDLDTFKYAYVLSRSRNYFRKNNLTGKGEPLTNFNKIFDGSKCEKAYFYNSDKAVLFIPGKFDIYQFSSQEIIIKLLEYDNIHSYFNEEEDE